MFTNKNLTSPFTRFIFCLISIFILSSCKSEKNRENEDMKLVHTAYKKGSFAYDLKFLQNYGEVIILKDASENAQVLVSPQYQGKVFTSTAGGLNGTSFGWINYDLVSSGKKMEHINAYGGEDRFWLGPEGGQFSIFFKPGVEMIFENWNTPNEIDTESFMLRLKNQNMVSMEKEMHLRNYSGTQFDLTAMRDVELLTQNDVEQVLHIVVDKEVQFVAYKTVNKIKNIGQNTWSKESGTLCIWILGMFIPSPRTTVVIPFFSGPEEELGKVATTDYFGKIPEDRLKIKGAILFFKADGKKRSKLGLSPLRAKNVAGSYDPDLNTLTIIHFTMSTKESEYINQLWEIQKEPFKGDVINSYNDGPLADGSQIGPFYELESSSPAAFLKPNESITHTHQTFHFVGNKEGLNEISEQVLGVDLETIQSIFAGK